MKPYVFKPFSPENFERMQVLARNVRESFKGTPYPQGTSGHIFNRWGVHQPKALCYLHHDPRLLHMAEAIFGERVRASYCFLSLYGHDGVCPRHVDRPQCKYTFDILIDGGEDWPLYVMEGEKIHSIPLRPGECVAYSGTDQEHWRKPMQEDSSATFASLAFFHFVPISFTGGLT